MQSYLYQRIILLSKPNILLHILSCFMATLGAGIAYLCMGWLVVQEYQNVASMAWLLAGFWLPQIICAPFIGVTVDRYSRKKVILWSNGLRVLCLLLIGVIYFYHQAIALIYLLALCIGFLYAFYAPAALAFVRDIAEPKDLLYANASVDMAYEIGFLFGMAMAGVILAYFSPAWTFIINAACFVVACLLTWFIRVDEGHIQKVKQFKNIWLGFQADVYSGMQYLFNHRHLFLLYSVQMSIYSIMLTAPILLTPFATLILKTSPLALSMIEGGYSLGVIIGSFLLPYCAMRWGMRSCLWISCLVAACLLAIFPFTWDLILACGLYILLGLVMASWALITTSVQNATDPAFQGRLQTCFNAIGSMIVLCIYVVVAVFSEFFDVKMSYSLLVILALCALGFVLTANFNIYHESNTTTHS